MSVPRLRWRRWSGWQSITPEALTRRVVRDAGQQLHGELESLRAEHDTLMEIVANLVARLPDVHAIAEVLDINPQDLAVDEDET